MLDEVEGLVEALLVLGERVFEVGVLIGLADEFFPEDIEFVAQVCHLVL